MTTAKIEKDDDSHMYDLYAVANHLGGMSGGHYTAMVKCEAEVVTLKGSGGGGGGAGGAGGGGGNGSSMLNMSSHSVASNGNSIHNSGHNSHNNSRNGSQNNSIQNSTREDSEGLSPALNDPNGVPLDTAWMCFDDDVVSMVPMHSLEATIVSGQCAHRFVINFFLKSLLACLPLSPLSPIFIHFPPLLSFPPSMISSPLSLLFTFLSDVFYRMYFF